MAVLIILGMASTSCDHRNTPNKEQPVIQLTEHHVDDEQIDSLNSINAFVSQIETLSKDQETNNNCLKDMSKEIEDMKETYRLFYLISLVIAAIALLVALIAIIKHNSVQKRADRHRKELGELGKRIGILEHNTVSSTRTKSAYSGISSSECSSLASRISFIERQLDKMIQNQTDVHQNIVQNRPVSEVRHYTDKQNGYFGLPTQKSLTEAYFKKLCQTRESDSRFTVSTRDNKAEFRPLEGVQYLNDLKSNDAVKIALDIQGCTISEATQMKVILPGEAQKDGDRWFITKKAIIALYK